MNWLLQNWVLVLIVVVFIWMHMSGRGCHGGHSRHRSHGEGEDKRSTNKAQSDESTLQD